MPKTILLVEDEEHMAEMYQMKFEQGGYSVIVAGNGEEGLRLAKEKKPDLILLDLVLPKMDGYEVLNRLKSDNELKDIKVYILSNLVQNGEINQGFKKGANGYLIKASLTPSQLLDNIEKIFSGEKVGVKWKTVKPEEKKIITKKIESDNIKDEGIRVLLIEDEEVIIDMYRLRLKREGYDVEAAKNGAWGIKLAKEKKFDIIIMDMVMPAMDGFKALEELRADNITKDLPIIVLSNSAQEKEITKAKKVGAFNYLLKSRITPARLIKEIKKALNKK